MVSVLDSQFHPTRGVGISDDEWHSDSTVAGGGTYQCYQRLFGRSKKSSKQTKNLDAGKFPGSHRVEPRCHPIYRTTSASQPHDSRRKARSVAQASASSPPSKPETKAQTEKGETPGNPSSHKESIVLNGGLENPDEADYSSDDPESCDGFESYRHSGKSRSERPSRGKNYRGRSRSAKTSQKSQAQEDKRHHPHPIKARNGCVLRASRGHDIASRKSRGRSVVMSPESFSDQIYNSSSGSDSDVPCPRLHKCDNEHGSAREKGIKHGYSQWSKSTINGRKAKSVEEIYVSSESSLNDDTLSDSTTGTVSPKKRRTGPCRLKQSATSESSTECPSENDQSGSKHCSKKPSMMARSNSRVRFNPEVEVQKLPTCGVCGEPEVKCESCATKSEEPDTPTNKGTVGHEPLKNHDGDQPITQEFDASAERETERRARSQRVYDSIFGSSTLGGRSTRGKAPPSGMAGSSGEQASGGSRNGAPPPYFANYRERGDQYARYAAPEFETYYAGSYGSFDYQEDGGYPNNGGYTYDPYSQPYGWQGPGAYGDSSAFTYGSDPSEAAWADAELRNRYGAYRANFTSSFATAPRGAYPTRNRSGVNAEPGQPSSFT